MDACTCLWYCCTTCYTDSMLSLSLRKASLLATVLPAGMLVVSIPLAGSPPPRAVPQSAVAAALLASISRGYLGTPYKLDCLGEERGPDRDPLFTRKCVDCQTLVEQVM